MDTYSNFVISLDKNDISKIDREVAELGIEKYLTRQLSYMDCTKVLSNGMRMIQTLGYPYRWEMSKYVYVLEGLNDDKDYFKIWEDKLIERHNANLEYEKENPPIWYGGEKAKKAFEKKAGKHPRKGKEGKKAISNEDRLKNLTATFGKLTFKIKPPKK